MTWTNYSTTPPNSWSVEIGANYDVTNSWADNSLPPIVNTTYNPQIVVGNVNTLRASYNIPGYEDGYQPAGVSDPISGSFGAGGGGGGSTRPTTGMLYPRGQG